MLLEVDQIDELNTQVIYTHLSVDEIENLPVYSPDESWTVSHKSGLNRKIEKDGSSSWDRT